MFAQALVELIGTFVFLSVIIASKGNPIAVGVALTAVVFMIGATSGAHVNPAITFMTVLDGKTDLPTAAIYILAQLIGAAAAFGFGKYVLTQ